MVCDEPVIEQHFASHSGEVTAVAFNPTGKQLASGSKDNSLVIWNFQKTIRAYRFQAHTLAVTDVCFSPKGNIVASSSCDRYVRLYVPSVKGESGGFRAHSSAVRSVHFSPCGEHIITASDDKTVKLWIANKRSCRFLLTMCGHTNWVRCARFSGDGKMVASCSEDKTFRLWDSRTGQLIHTINELAGYGNHVEFHPSGNFIGGGMSNSVVKLYDIRNYKLVQHYQKHDGPVNRISFHPNGKYMITASSDATVKVLDIREGRPIYTLTGHVGAVTAVAFSSDGGCFASGGADKQVFVWKTNFDKDFSAKSTKSEKSVALITEEKDTVTNVSMPEARISQVERIYSPCDFEETGEQGGGDSNSNMYTESVKSLPPSVRQRTSTETSYETHSAFSEKRELENEKCKCHLNTSAVLETIVSEIANIKKMLERIEHRVSAVEQEVMWSKKHHTESDDK